MEISVIIPTYKPDYYIWECLDSLRNQTLEENKFEVLIILNGEKEPYYNDILEYIQVNKIKNFKLIYTEKLGVSNARNKGLDLAQGEYITFLDDDDYIDKNYLEELLKKNKEIGKNGIVVTNYTRFEEKTNINLSRTNYKLGEIEKNICKKRKVFSVVWAKIIPKNIIKNIKFNIKFQNGEDSLFMITISKNIESVAVIDNETLYHRRVRKNSAHFRKKSIKEIYINIFLLMKEYIKLFLNKNYNKKIIILRILAIIKGAFFQLKRV